jgi:putative phosphoesterase
MLRIGVISDTHGYLHPRAPAALRGVARILHAGDIGDEQVIAALEQIAPVTAVYGNVDAGTALARRYPGRQMLELGGRRIVMTHIGGEPAALARALPEPRPDVYIFGHTHMAVLDEVGGTLFLNPGAAGRPRFGGVVSVALLEIAGGRVSARIVPL